MRSMWPFRSVRSCALESAARWLSTAVRSCSMIGYAYIVPPAKQIAESPRGSGKSLGQQSQAQPKRSRLSVAITISSVAPTLRSQASARVILLLVK